MVPFVFLDRYLFLLNSVINRDTKFNQGWNWRTARCNLSCQSGGGAGYSGFHTLTCGYHSLQKSCHSNIMLSKMSFKNTFWIWITDQWYFAVICKGESIESGKLIRHRSYQNSVNLRRDHWLEYQVIKSKKSLRMDSKFCEKNSVCRDIVTLQLSLHPENS